MMRKPRILLVEDESAIRHGLTDVLVYHGYEVDTAADGDTGLNKALSGRFELILLDVMLPGMNGFEICNRIREQDREQAIIMLTAKDDDADIIQGLSLGADDYVAKPFSVTQLVLRIRAVLRRTRAAITADSELRLGEEVVIDTRNLSGRNGKTDLSFTRREMDLLQYLHANSDRAVPRDELLNKLWGYGRDLDIETRTIDIHVAKLRRKIETDPSQPRYLVTIRGAGYRLIGN